MSKLIRNPLVTGILWTTLAMAAPVDRIQGPIGASRSFVLPGHIRTLSASYIDQGPIPASQHLDGLILFFKPSALQKNDLDQLLIQLHDPASAIYHQWLTPEDYADRFGVSPSDAGKIANWLEAQGFHVGRLGRARSYIVFDGPAGAVESAFRAGIHRYRSADSVHYVNSKTHRCRMPFRILLDASAVWTIFFQCRTSMQRPTPHRAMERTLWRPAIWLRFTISRPCSPGASTEQVKLWWWSANRIF